MAAANYNEVTHSARPDWNNLDPLYHWDTHFPEKFSKLNLNPEYGAPVAKKKSRRGRSRCDTRYKTQPITFDEIKEVDEEGGADDGTQEGFKNQLLAFSRSMDGLIPRYAIKSASQSPSAASNLSVEDMRIAAMTPDGASAAACAHSTAASGPTGSDEGLFTSGTSDNTSTGPILIPDGLSAHAGFRRQKRRSRKKHTRSIEELPEAVEEGKNENSQQKTG